MSLGLGRRLRWALACLVPLALWPTAPGPQADRLPAPAAEGQSVTQMADGRWLIAGGRRPEGVVGAVVVDDRQRGTTTALPPLQHARAWHTATVLPNGAVLVFGGLGADGQTLGAPELLDPDTLTWSSPPFAGPAPRARHSATLLTDRRVLIAGGRSATGDHEAHAELWRVDTGQVERTASLLASPRTGHVASLLASGDILVWGGVDQQGVALEGGELFEADAMRFSPTDVLPAEPLPADVPTLDAAVPADGAIDVGLGVVIALRFSKSLAPDTAHAGTVTLTCPTGPEPARVVAAEAGRLVFVTPRAPLRAGSAYTVLIDGVRDTTGVVAPLMLLRFTTAMAAVSSTGAGSASASGGTRPLPAVPDDADDAEPWEWSGERRNGRPYSPWQSLAPLQARPGSPH